LFIYLEIETILNIWNEQSGQVLQCRRVRMRVECVAKRFYYKQTCVEFVVVTHF
jgi:hypothetical protein